MMNKKENKDISQKSNRQQKPARRRLLGALSMGGAAALSLKQLPQSWSKPVVDSVLLPVHAQSSGDNTAPASDSNTTPAPNGNTTPAPGCPSLSISGTTLNCPPASGSPQTYTRYQVDDSGTCPVLTSVALTVFSVPSADALQVELRELTGNNRIGITVRVATESDGIANATGGITSCIDPAGCTPDINGNQTFLASSGATWQAVFSLTCTGPTISVSNIALTPM